MHRFFTTEIQPDTAVVRGEDVKHIAKVLRLHAGDRVQLCDGNGRECEAAIRSVSSDAVVFDTEPWQIAQTEPRTKITLFQCLPKAGKMETIIQKCVEIGVCGFVPVQSERCVVVLKPPYEGRIERWQRVSEEAAKQSRRGVIPQVALPTALDKLDFSDFDTVLAPYENERTVSLKTALRASCGTRVAVVIGPEGGFSDAEIACLVEKGAVSVSLGPRILRTETAGMATAAQILYEVEL
ncbi:MAG: 16S rRNA (uracil(1498)-N(3))-methyltransferase [Clostridia bacterium]|nr:16S rRNA (uracil(1498)-N(3))-methyltransferase [Clostridia bacterium]